MKHSVHVQTLQPVFDLRADEIIEIVHVDAPQHHQAHPPLEAQLAGDDQRTRDHRQVAVFQERSGDGPGHFEDGRAGIEHQGIAGQDQAGRSLADGALGSDALEKPGVELRDLAGACHGLHAAVDTFDQTGLFELGEIAADRHRRHAELPRQICRTDKGAAQDFLQDLSIPVFS